MLYFVGCIADRFCHFQVATVRAARCSVGHLEPGTKLALELPLDPHEDHDPGVRRLGESLSIRNLTPQFTKIEVKARTPGSSGDLGWKS